MVPAAWAAAAALNAFVSITFSTMVISLRRIKLRAQGCACRQLVDVHVGLALRFHLILHCLGLVRGVSKKNRHLRLDVLCRRTCAPRSTPSPLAGGRGLVLAQRRELTVGAAPRSPAQGRAAALAPPLPNANRSARLRRR